MSKLARMLAAVLLVGVMLSSTVPLALADTDLEIGGLAIVANTGGDAAMVRDGAGYDFAVLLTAAEGTALTITDGPFAGDDGALWYEVNLDGTIAHARTIAARAGDRRIVTAAAAGSLRTATATAGISWSILGENQEVGADITAGAVEINFVPERAVISRKRPIRNREDRPLRSGEQNGEFVPCTVADHRGIAAGVRHNGEATNLQVRVGER